MFYIKHNKTGSIVLYAVCVALLGMFFLLLSFQYFKSGQVNQLTKSIDQEKMAAIAQAGVNELIAMARAQINDPGNTFSDAVKSVISGGGKSFSMNVSSGSMSRSNAIAKEILGSGATVSGTISWKIEKSVGSLDPSYIGLMSFEASIGGKGFSEKINALEEREIKIVNLASSFFDKYVLYVKSFCATLNDSSKTFVITGIPASPAAKKCSFVYLGNRNYPTSTEYPNGDGPVLLDVTFDDKYLLGGFFKQSGFNSTNEHYRNATQDKFFHVEEIQFNSLFSSYDELKGVHTVEQLLKIYNELIDIASPYVSPNSFSASVMKAHNEAGGDPAASRVFRVMVEECIPLWKYHYGFTDYNTLDEIISVNPFNGLGHYFSITKDKNIVRARGGKMPLLFGEDRKTTVFVEGPVYARFFKVAFLDDVAFDMQFGDFESQFYCGAIPMDYEDPEKTFMFDTKSLKYSFSDRVFSHPIDDKIGKVPINKFYFGASEPQKQPKMLSSGSGADQYPDISSMELFSHIYTSVSDFEEECISSDGVLELDGFIAVTGSIDLSKVSKYRGKGYIVSLEGHCTLGNLQPENKETDILKIYLMNGSFSAAGDAQISASLVATAKGGNQCTFFTNEHAVEIYGNLVVDALAKMDATTNLRITHNPYVYSHPYPVRASIGQSKIRVETDYTGESN